MSPSMYLDLSENGNASSPRTSLALNASSPFPEFHSIPATNENTITTPSPLTTPSHHTPVTRGRSLTKSKSMTHTEIQSIVSQSPSYTPSKPSHINSYPFPPFDPQIETLSTTITHLRSLSPPPTIAGERQRRASLRAERKELVSMLRDRTAWRAKDLGVEVEGLKNLERDGTGQLVFPADRLGRRRTSLGVRASALAGIAGISGRVEDDHKGTAMSRARAITYSEVSRRGDQK